MVKIINKRVLSVLLTLAMLLSFCNNLIFDNYSMNANATSNIYSEQNWEQAAKDGCYDGFFHNAVQEYLVAPTHGYGFQKEMKISYNQIVFNPVSKKDTTYGKVDIYKQIDSSTYYIWELKPVSYNNGERKKLAIQAL